MACCIFKDCFNKPVPFGTVVFFNLPKDEPRRGQWLSASGNEEVQNLPASAKRLVCEDHFEERYMRRQFHRTTLNRDAVPVDYRVRKGDSLANETAKVKEIKEAQDKSKEEESLAAEQEEVLLISADEESDYEVLVEEMLCDEDFEARASEEQLVIEGNQTDDVFDDFPQKTDEVVEAFVIEEEESCEEEFPDADHKQQEDTDDINLLGSTMDVTATESHPEESLEHENNTDEQAQNAAEDPGIEEAKVTNSKPKVFVNTAKHKLAINVVSSQPAKRLKSDEVVEPDTSSVSVTPVAAVTQKEVSNPPVIEQPSTSSCTSSAVVAPAASASGKMSEEEYFALSLVGPLQRLPPAKRAIAKMKILTYLVQLECGLTDADL